MCYQKQNVKRLAKEWHDFVQLSIAKLDQNVLLMLGKFYIYQTDVLF